MRTFMLIVGLVIATAIIGGVVLPLIRPSMLQASLILISALEVLGLPFDPASTLVSVFNAFFVAALVMSPWYIAYRLIHQREERPWAAYGPQRTRR